MLQTNENLTATLLRLSGPILAASALQTICQTIDLIWVGRLDTESVATVGACYPIIALLTGLYTGLLTATFVLVAQYCGARDGVMLARVAAQSLVLLAITSIVFSSAAIVNALPLLHLMGIDAALIKHATTYVRISLVGVGFVSAVGLYASVMRGQSEVRAALYMTALGATLNMALDPVLIFGVGPISAGGVTGAAYATLLAQATTTVVALRRLCRGDCGTKLRAKDFIPDIALMKQIILLGAPASFGACIDPVALLVFTGIVASFGTVAVAVNGVALRIFAFSVVLQTSISSAIGILVGAAMGAGHTTRAQTIGARSTCTLFVISIALGVLAFSFAKPLVSIFVPPNTSVIMEGTRAVRWMAVCFPFVGTWLGLTGTFTSAGDTLFPMVSTFVIYWTVEIPLAWVLSRHTGMGTEGLWVTYPVSAFVGALAGLVWFRLGRWKRMDLTGVQRRIALGEADRTMIRT